ncbi:MAG: hypothetical protein AB7P78_20665 [Candidatus Binatia bacterium]
MFRLKHLQIDTLQEHVIFLHEESVHTNHFGFRPLDRVRVVEVEHRGAVPREITGVLNFCRDALVAPGEIGVSDVAARDLGLPPGALVRATLSPAPRSIDLVRGKLHGRQLDQAACETILSDVRSIATRRSSSRCSCSAVRCCRSTATS